MDTTPPPPKVVVRVLRQRESLFFQEKPSKQCEGWTMTFSRSLSGKQFAPRRATMPDPHQGLCGDWGCRNFLREQGLGRFRVILGVKLNPISQLLL